MSKDFKNFKRIMEEIDKKKLIEITIRQQNVEQAFHSFDTKNHYTK